MKYKTIVPKPDCPLSPDEYKGRPAKWGQLPLQTVPCEHWLMGLCSWFKPPMKIREIKAEEQRNWLP